MNRLIKYELFKITGKKLFWIMLFCVLILNVFVLWWMNKGDEFTPNYKDYKEVNNSICALSNEEKIKHLNKQKEIVEAIGLKEEVEYSRANKEKSIFTEDTEKEYKEVYKKYKDVLDKDLDYEQNSKKAIVIDDALNELNELSKYSENLDEIQNKAEILSSSSIFGGQDENDFDTSNIKKTSKDFESIEGVKINYDINNGVNLFLKLSITDLLILIMVMFSALCLITDEKEKELFGIVKATKKGNSQTIGAKIFALFISVFFVSALTILSSYIFVDVTYGFGDLTRSIQSVPAFMTSTLKLNLLQYLLLISGCKIVGAFIIGLIMILFAIITKNKIFVLIDSIVVLVLSMITYFSIPMSSKFNWLKVLNLTNFIVPNNVYGKYYNLNLFSKPVNVATAFIYFSIIVLVLFVFINVFTFSRKKDLTCKSSNRIRLKGFNSKGIHLLKHQTAYEVKKILSTNQVVIILILFIGLQIYSMVNITDKKDIYDIYYKNYMTAVEGKLTPAKEKYITKQKAKFDKIHKEMDKINEDYASGKIPWQEKISKEEKYDNQLNGEDAFSRVYSRYLYIKSHDKAEFVYDTGYNELFNIENEDFGLFNGLQLIVVIALCLSGVFSVEYKTGMYKVLAATQKGTKKTINKKIIISLVIATAIFVIAYIPDFHTIKTMYGFRQLGAPISSLPAFENMGTGMSILGYTILLFFTRLLFILLLSIIILALSLIIKNNIYTSLVSIGIFASPIILHILDIKIFDKASIMPLILTNGYYLRSDSVFVSVMQILTLVIFALISLILIYRRFGNSNTFKIKSKYSGR